MKPGVQAAAQSALAACDVEAKLSAAAWLWADWQAGEVEVSDFVVPVECAGLPARPVLADPRTMPRRQLGSEENHAALIHALTHIEFNAINLALDAVQRFSGFPPAYYADWLRIAAEEAEHFQLLRQHLRGLRYRDGRPGGWDYGSFPAHAGLWELAQKTAHDALARMALVPRLMEARGLDVTPDIQRKLTGFGDRAGAAILDIILRDEMGHVAAGDRWFRWLCTQRGLDAEATYINLLATPGVPRPRRPFNEAARLCCGFSQAELLRLAALSDR